ncbi:hypothetical protein JD969_02085 [Planctomycetota bacterium]|nr:hypothetical protein JD969_02085 [Planctomycetota bacterium]
MSHKFTNNLLILCLSTLALIFTGCVTKPYADPISVMLDTSRPGSSRLKAMIQIEEQQQQFTPQQSKRYIKSLNGLVWNDSHPLEIRQKATKTLLNINKQAFLETSNDLITIVDQWNMLNYLFELAIQENWKSYTIAATHSWARTSQLYSDDVRPERKLIETLNPDQQTEKVLLDIFLGNYKANSTNPTFNITQRHQIAAWIVLTRIMSEQDLYAALSESKRNSIIADDLFTMKQYLSQLPKEREGLLWLNFILHQQTRLGNSDNFDDLLQFKPESSPKKELQVRHIPSVLHNVRTGPNRAIPMSLVKQYVAKQQRYPRVDHPHKDNETIDLQTQLISQADYIVLMHVIQTINTPLVRQTLFNQADDDILDNTTELGGVLTWDSNNQPIAQPFAPEIKAHDRKFYASNQLIESMYTGLAHYHFHAQDHENATYAGPGKGDLSFANRLGTHAVVFTFIDKNTLNVDYYQPGGVVIDLGTISRP